MHHRSHTVVDSPVGPLTLVAADGVLAGLYMQQQRHRPPESAFGEPDASPFGEAVGQLDEYFARQRTDFDLPLALFGTPFQQTVWAALRHVGYGETVSYGTLAERIGRPGSARAVGLANGRNPISIIVPCHRVLGSTGDLTGYGGGLDRKRYLLDFERTSGVPALVASRHASRDRRPGQPVTASNDGRYPLEYPVAVGWNELSIGNVML